MGERMEVPNSPKQFGGKHHHRRRLPKLYSPDAQYGVRLKPWIIANQKTFIPATRKYDPDRVAVIIPGTEAVQKWFWREIGQNDDSFRFGTESNKI